MKQNGQVTIEAVLIITLLMTITMAASRQFSSQGVLQKLVGSPWEHMRGMIENGIWDPTTPNSYHPNSKKRHATAKPDRT